MADSAVLAKAKLLLSYDVDDLDTKLSECEAPALELFEKEITSIDFNIFYNTALTSNILSFSQGSESVSTLCKCEKLLDVSQLVENQKIVIVSTTYAGIYKVFNLNYDSYTFEINKVFSITETGTFTNSRKTSLEYAAAYFLLYSLISQAQEIRNKKVLFSSSNFGEGTINQASLQDKKDLADSYISKAYQYLDYNYSESI